MNWRRKSAEGLSPSLMFLWSLSAIFLGVYNIVQDINIPLIVQPQVFGFLAAFCWTQCLFYDSKKSLHLCIFLLVIYSSVAAGFETGMTFLLRRAVQHDGEGGQRGLQFFGIMSSVLISIGLLPQYVEIYRLKQVKGISYTFMAIDIGGGVFSILSLAFKAKWDVIASLVYLLVIVLDSLILISACILNPRAKKRLAREEREKRDNEGQSSTPSNSTNIPASI